MDVELRRSSRWAWNAITWYPPKEGKQGAVGVGAGRRGGAGGRQTHREQQEKMKPWRQRSEWCSQKASQWMQAATATCKRQDKSEGERWLPLNTHDFSPINLMLRFWSSSHFCCFRLSVYYWYYISYKATNTQINLQSLQNSCSKPLMCTQPPSSKYNAQKYLYLKCKSLI